MESTRGGRYQSTQQVKATINLPLDLDLHHINPHCVEWRGTEYVSVMITVNTLLQSSSIIFSTVMQVRLQSLPLIFCVVVQARRALPAIPIGTLRTMKLMESMS